MEEKLTFRYTSFQPVIVLPTYFKVTHTHNSKENFQDLEMCRKFLKATRKYWDMAEIDPGSREATAGFLL